MRPKPLPSKTTPGERVVKDIRRATRRHFSAEDKIRIVLDGLRGEDSIAEGSVKATANTLNLRPCSTEPHLIRLNFFGLGASGKSAKKSLYFVALTVPRRSRPWALSDQIHAGLTRRRLSGFMTKAPT